MPVTIAQGAEAAIVLPNTLQLQANGAPGGGAYQWTVRAPGIVQFQGAQNLANVTVASLAPGSTSVDVSYTLNGDVSRASIILDVITVAVQPSPSGAMLYPGVGNPPATLALQAAGAPAGGTYGWAVTNALVAQLQGPTNQANATVASVGPGATVVTASYTAGGQVATATTTINVVGVTLNPSPTAAVVLPNTQALQANGQPGGGVYTWTIGSPAVAQFQGGPPGSTPNVTLDTLTAGATQVNVAYAAAGLIANAAMTLNVVDVTLNPSPEASMAYPGPNVAPNTLLLQAAGAPGNGVYAWTVNGNAARFQGGLNPGNNANATLETVSPGTCSATVTYTLNGVVASETVTVDVVGVAIREAPTLSVPFPTQPTLHATGTPAGGTFAWTVGNPNVAQIQGSANQANVTLNPLVAGSTQVNVAYTAAGQTVTAMMTLNVVGVTVAPSPSASVISPNTQAFQAVGTPGGGVYTWTIASPAVAQFQGGPPGNTANVTLTPLMAGSTQVNVAYSLFGQTVNATTTLNVVGVTLTPSPSASVTLSNTQALQATGTPLGGIYVWTIANPLIAQFQGGPPGSTANVTLTPLAAGTTQVNVAYTAFGQTVNAATTFNAVEVTLNPSPEAEMVYPGVGALPATLPLQAAGTPLGGTYAWAVRGNAVRFQGGVAPGNAANATIETVNPGSCSVDVSYTLGAAVASGTVIVDVVGVTVAPAPVAAMLYPGAGALANTVALTATGLPAGGTYAWQSATPAAADFQGGAPGNVANVTMASGVNPGATNVTATYTIRTAAATAQTSVEVVAINIQEGEMMGGVRVLGVLHPAVGNGTQVLTSVGAPGGGAPTWRAIPVLVPPVIRYQGGVATVNNPNATIETLATGTNTVTVQYVQSGQTATSAIELRVRDVGCSCVTWAPAGAANVAPRPRRGCPHGPGGFVPTRFQYPSLAPPGVATVAPTTPHHHGTRCYYCVLNGRRIDHWVDPYGAAMNDVLALRDQIQALRALLGGWTPASPLPMPVLAANYILANPWLANVPAWLYDPLAGQGIMLGVLRGVDVAGNQFLLRAASGVFPGLALANPTNGVPNAYWSRPLQNPLNIFSASWGQFAYPGYGYGRTTFGKCAAARLLAHALLLQLQVDSMAEIWLGATLNARVDGQLQASCQYCRVYFEHMLCDQGVTARGTPAFINNLVPPAVPNRGF